MPHNIVDSMQRYTYASVHMREVHILQVKLLTSRHSTKFRESRWMSTERRRRSASKGKLERHSVEHIYLRQRLSSYV